MTRPARCHLCGARLTPGTRVRKWNVWTCKDGLACCARQGGEKPEKAMAKRPPIFSAFARDTLRKFDGERYLVPVGLQVRTCHLLERAGFMERKQGSGVNPINTFRTNAAGREALAGSEGK